MFHFSAGSSIRNSKAIVAAKTGQEDEVAMSTETFIQQNIPCSTWYVCQIPLATPDAPFSRMLQLPHFAHKLTDVSLSTVIGHPMESNSPQHRDDSEFFCWEVMDHVSAFPYTHPDGMAPGTKDFGIWRMSIQKQYAVLMHQSRNLLRRVLECRECLNAAREVEYKVQLDQYAKLDRLAALEDEKHHAEQEYNGVVRRIQGFRREQKMLRAAFQKVVVRCMKEGRTKTPIQQRHLQHTKYICSGGGPLKRGSKRKVMDEHSRSSSARRQDGHGFNRQQTKQRKLFEQEETESTPGVGQRAKQRRLLKQAEAALEQGIAALKFSIPSSKERQGDEDTASTASLEESSARRSEQRDDGSGSTIIVSDNEHSEPYQADASHLPLAQPKPCNPAQTEARILQGEMSPVVESTMTDLSLDRNERSTKQASGSISSSEDLSDLEAAEAIYAALQRQYDEVQDMRARIAKTLEECEAPRPALTVEEVEAMIPAIGIGYADLVAELEGRVPDTRAGIRLLRELIDDAGFFDKETSMVYPRGEVMFGWMVDL